MNRFLSNLEPSSTLELNQLAKNLVKQGRSVVNLTAGEPDFNTPKRILKAAEKAMQDGKTKYTQVAGIIELREAIRNFVLETYGREYGADEVVVTNGGKQAIFNLCFSLLNPGDEVIIPTPAWVSYESIVKMVGAVPVTVPTGIDRSFEPDISAIESKISPKTKLILINSPNNPSGMVFSEQFFSDLQQLLLRHSHMYVLTDDIYDRFVYDGVPFYSIGMSKQISSDRLIIVGGVSKTYAMTGWRVGYAVGPKPIVSVMSNVQSQTTSNVCSISQWAALEAIQGSTHEEINGFLQMYQQRRDLAYETLREIPKISCKKPAGAFYILPLVEPYLGLRSPTGKNLKSDVDLSYDLLERKGLASVPGTAFGLPGYLRFSFVVESSVWKDGMHRLNEGLSELK